MPMKALILATVLLISGCTSMYGSSAGDAISQSPALEGEPLDQVMIRVKQEVGFFIATQPKTDSDWAELFASLKILDANGELPKNMCGKGRIKIKISTVAMDFTASKDTTDSLSGGLKIPFGLSAFAANISPNGKVSNENVATFDGKYTYNNPEEDTVDPSEWAFLAAHPESATIKGALDSLRNSLIKAAAHRLCFGNTPKGSKADTLQFSIQVKQDVNASVGFSFIILSAAGTAEQVRSHGNTITVTFEPS
jgi:hypothetical protein